MLTNEVKTFGDPKKGVEYTERHGAYAIALQNESILIEEGRIGYFLPGGGIENEETPEQALVREMLEETGYSLLSYEKLGYAIEYLFIQNDNRYQKKINHFYVVELGSKTEPTYPDGHVYPVNWISIRDVQEKMHLKSHQWAIEEALKHDD